MNYKHLKALAKVCDQKAEPGQAMQSPVLGDDMCYATDNRMLVRVTGRSVSKLCKELEAPSQVPSALINGFGSREVVKPDDISIAVSKPIGSNVINRHIDATGNIAPVMVDPVNLIKVMNVYKAFGITPIVRTVVKESTSFPYVIADGQDINYEVKACVAGIRM